MAARRTATRRAPRAPQRIEDDADEYLESGDGATPVELAKFPDDGRTAPTEERREKQLEEILSALNGNDGRIAVWHIIDGRMTFAGHMSPEGFSLDSLLDTYGGGEKSLAIYQGSEHKETIKVSLDPTIPPTSPRAKALLANRNPAASGAPSIGEFGALLASITQAQRGSTEVLVTMMNAQATQMSGLMTALVASLTAQKGAAADPAELMVKAIDAVAKLRPAETAGGSLGMAEMVKLLDRGIALGKGLNGDDDGSNIMPVVGKGLEAITEVVRAMRPQAMPGAPVAMIPAPETTAPIPDTAMPKPTLDNSNPAPNDRLWVAAARPLLTNLGPWVQHVSPAMAASLIDDALDDAAFDDLMADMNESGAQFGARLGAYFPTLFANVPGEWVAKVIEELLKHDEADDGAEVDTDGEGERAQAAQAARNGAAISPARIDMLLSVLSRLNFAASMVKQAIGNESLLDATPDNEAGTVRQLVATGLREAADVLDPPAPSTSTGDATGNVGTGDGA